MVLDVEAYKGMEIQANRTSLHRGFSLVELIAVIAIILVLAGVAAPNFIRALYNARLRGAGNDIASMVQLCRIRAVQDSRYYGVYLHAGSGTSPQEVFVDIYPQNVNGASGSGGLTIDPKDPVAVIPAEVTQQSPTSAPNTTGLAQLLLPTNPNSLVPTDGSSIATPITFGPEGLPCKPLAVTGGTVCNSRGGAGAVAYWVFLQDTRTQAWEAVTTTPAGRIQRWTYSSGTWSKL